MMIPPAVFGVAAVGTSLLLAWWPWRGELTTPLARVAAFARAVAIFALILLVLDPGIGGRLSRGEPLVLLDNSVSMHAAGGRLDSALALAERTGEVLRFGELAPDLPGATSTIGDALSAAVTAGRPVTLVSDGEISDVGAIPPDLLAQVDITTLPRETAPDVAISDVRMPTRVAAGDTLRVDIDLIATGGWQDSVTVVLRSDESILSSARAGFVTADVRSTLRMAVTLPTGFVGPRWLEITIPELIDSEPEDHLRWRYLDVTPSPGIVVIAEQPDWDSRFLYSTLASVTASPVRGFIQLTPGLWRRMDDFTPVAVGEVARAARGADLVAVRGDTAQWRGLGRARLLWPSGGEAGDWYLSAERVSPLVGGFAGIDPADLPPVPLTASLPPADWIALVARDARRGEPIPVVTGRERGGRTILISAQGLYRWAFRGGVSELAWRTMIAESASWLLDAPVQEGAQAQPVRPVTQRGRPVRFRSSTTGQDVLPLTITDGELVKEDTLRFDSEGFASLALPPGRYRYSFESGLGGELGVEPFSDELIPSRVAIESQSAVVTPASPRRSLHELLPIFLLSVLGFSLEWILRRRLGLR